MLISLNVNIDEVEEDADLGIIRAAVERAVKQAMPFHTVAVDVEWPDLAPRREAV